MHRAWYRSLTIGFLIVCFGLFFISLTNIEASNSTSTETYSVPKLSIKIPNLSFSQILKDGDQLKINYLADYVDGFYKYLLTITITIAVIMGSVGGVQYILASGSGNVKEAEKRIEQAIIGMVILFSAVLILFIVNPQLTIMKALVMETIDPVEYVRESGDEPGGVNASGSSLQSLGISCTGSGDVATIAKQFQGKTTYRLGAKGGPPPYPADTKTAPDGTPYKNFCPNGSVCLDCSGFVAMVAKCTGLPPRNEDGGTWGIFQNAEVIESCTKTGVKTAGGTYELTPGDLIGFKAGDFTKQKSFGHVFMYVGNGSVMDSHGSKGGRSAGNAIGFQPLEKICNIFPVLRFVDR